MHRKARVWELQRSLDSLNHSLNHTINLNRSLIKTMARPPLQPFRTFARAFSGCLGKSIVPSRGCRQPEQGGALPQKTFLALEQPRSGHWIFVVRQAALGMLLASSVDRGFTGGTSARLGWQRSSPGRPTKAVLTLPKRQQQAC